MKRRRFVKTVSSAGLGLVAARAPLFASGSPAEKVVVCVMGLNQRGTVLARVFAKTPNAEVAAVCDVDAKVLAKAAAAVGEAQGKPVKAIVDFRRALDDKSIDALVIAAPDHWHAPATILACTAGKHVYVEKPGSHNAREGELMVAADLPEGCGINQIQMALHQFGKGIFGALCGKAPEQFSIFDHVHFKL